jgi:uncharacterized protein DUF6151
MGHPLQCRCGTIRGSVENPRSGNRVICYCKDCQAFAYFLGREKEVLDERGGSDVIQVLPRNVTFTQGIGSLACMRLTPKGLVRWYAGCCKTPIGNTLSTPKLSFVGLVHTCLHHSNESLDEAFGPVRCRVNVKSARGEPKPKSGGTGTMIGWFFGSVLRARFNGDYRRTPFFDIETNTPIVAPQVLSAEEHTKLMSAVRTA